MKFATQLFKNIPQSYYYRPMFFGKTHKNRDYLRFLESYGRFTLENPSANRQQRQEAIRRFLDTTRESICHNQLPAQSKRSKDGTE